MTSAAQPPVGDEAEFDFDSNANDVAAGATSIQPSFIQGNAITGSIINAGGQTVASSTVGCRVKN